MLPAITLSVKGNIRSLKKEAIEAIREMKEIITVIYILFFIERNASAIKIKTKSINNKEGINNKN
ncbi:MAG TPA: hypothetical protein V6D12_21905 [Candidatus Obscuribacterales bacterium]